ncbi:hypothetical protein LCGC14_2903180, partial [marine sediment metagenome]
MRQKTLSLVLLSLLLPLSLSAQTFRPRIMSGLRLTMLPGQSQDPMQLINSSGAILALLNNAGRFEVAVLTNAGACTDAVFTLTPVDGTFCVVSKATGTDFFYQVDATNPIVIGTSAISFLLASYPNVDIPIIQAEINYGLTTVDLTTSYDVDDARRYGAAMDGDDASPTDDTAAFDIAFGVSAITIRLYGTYAVGDLDIQDSSIDGQGIGKFVAISGATDVLVVNAYTGDSWHTRRIEKLAIDATGDTIRTVNAIALDRAGDHLAAGLIVDTCYIDNANIGIYKPNGSIGDQILTCTVKNCNYGYFAEDSTAPIQHPGASRIQAGMWNGHRKAAIYISSDAQNA